MGCSPSLVRNREAQLKNEILNRSPFFLYLNEDDLMQLSTLFDLKEFPAQYAVARKGDVLDRFYVIGAGVVLFTLDSTEHLHHKQQNGNMLVVSKEQTHKTDREEETDTVCGWKNSLLTSRTTGALFGQVGILSEGSFWTHSVITNTPTTCIYLTKEKLSSFLNKRPELSLSISSALGDDIEIQLRGIPLFRGINDERIRLLAAMLHFASVNAEEVLFLEGDVRPEGNSLFIVYQGELKAIAIDPEGRETVLNVFRKGQFFGEIGLMIDIPRTATVVAIEKSLVLELNKADFQNFLHMNDDPQLIENLNELLKKRTAEHFRKYRIPFFSLIPDEKYAVLAKLCKIEQMNAGTVVFKEGDVGDHFYIIAHGRVSVRCTKLIEGKQESIELAQLSPGNYFGESTVLQDGKRNATVVTACRCVLVSIGKENLKKFFAEVPESFADFEVRLAKYDVTLKSLLIHPLAVLYFKKHLQREYAVENLEFWNAIQAFHLKYNALFGSDTSEAAEADDEQPTDMIPTNDFLAEDEEQARYHLRPGGSSPISGKQPLPSIVPLGQLEINPNPQDARISMLMDATVIASTFIAEKAPHQVNINGSTKVFITKILELERRLQLGEEVPGDKVKRLDANTFHQAQREVWALMQSDSLPRFKQSELFQEFLDENEKAQQGCITAANNRFYKVIPHPSAVKEERSGSLLRRSLRKSADTKGIGQLLQAMSLQQRPD